MIQKLSAKYSSSSLNPGTPKSNQSRIKSQTNPSLKNAPALVKLSQRSQRQAVNYEGKRIGEIRPGLGCWIAEAQLQYGAGKNRLENESLAKNWLLKNYLKVHNSGIKFEVSENYCHYTIEKGYWLIKIDETPEDYIATIQDCNDLKYAYFPDLRSAIVCSFDLILNPTPINSNSSYGEF